MSDFVTKNGDYVITDDDKKLRPDTRYLKKILATAPMGALSFKFLKDKKRFDKKLEWEKRRLFCDNLINIGKEAATIYFNAYETLKHIRKKRNTSFTEGNHKERFANHIVVRQQYLNETAFKSAVKDFPFPMYQNVYALCYKFTAPATYGKHSQDFRINYHARYNAQTYWHVELPVTYFINVKKVRENKIHTCTYEGAKTHAFITRYFVEDQIGSISVFKCNVSRYDPETRKANDAAGWYLEQLINDELFISAFGFNKDRAMSLLKKRHKSIIMEQLGAAA